MHLLNVKYPHWLLLNTASTLFMCGVIAIVQVVHYPLFAQVGADFAAYEQAHTRLITFVVMPPMLLELGSSLVLLRTSEKRTLAALGFALVLGIWASTFFLQVPAHAALSHGFDAQVHARLVNTNLIRTLLWFARGALCVHLLLSLFKERH